jgi:hypothetical protein
MIEATQSLGYWVGSLVGAKFLRGFFTAQSLSQTSSALTAKDHLKQSTRNIATTLFEQIRHALIDSSCGFARHKKRRSQ